MPDPTRILVVDDERFFREAIRDALLRADLECELAEDGEQALARAGAPGLGVVILDVQMPGLSGLEVLRRLREERPLLRVIMLSAHTDQHVVLEALRLGACDYLAKPLHEEELVLAIRRALDANATARRLGALHRRLATLHGELAELRRVAREPEDEDRSTLLHERAVLAAARVLDAGRTSLLLLDPEHAVLRVAAALGGPVPAEEMDPVGVGEGVAGATFARGRPLVVRDAKEEGVPSPAPPDRYASRSFAVLPLAEGSERLGVLCATERGDGAPFEDEDRALLEILGEELTALLRPASAPAPAPLQPAPEAVEAYETEPGADAELARAICTASTSDVVPERVLAASVAAASAALGGAPAALYLFDGECDGLVLEASHDTALRPDRERLPPRRGLTGAVFETGQLVATARPEDDPRFDVAVDTPEDGEAGPLLCVPLSFKRRPLGVFRAFPDGPGAPSARTAEVLAAALSAAVRNVLLYRSLLEAIEEVARARREAGDDARGGDG